MFGFHAFAEAPFATLPNVAEIVVDGTDRVILTQYFPQPNVSTTKPAILGYTTATTGRSTLLTGKGASTTIVTGRAHPV